MSPTRLVSCLFGGETDQAAQKSAPVRLNKQRALQIGCAAHSAASKRHRMALTPARFTFSAPNVFLTFMQSVKWDVSDSHPQDNTGPWARWDRTSLCSGVLDGKMQDI